MAKKNFKSKKPVVVQKTIPGHRGSTASILDKLEKLISKRLKWITIASLLLFLIIGTLLFDGYIIPMADDANFIVEASNFLKYGVYPTFSSVFYTALLAVPALVFGFNVVSYKLFSFVMGGLGIWIYYKSFKNYFPSIVVAAVLLFISTNYALQFYNSSTLSESFFMTMQYGFLGLSFYLLNKFKEEDFAYDGLKSRKTFWASTIVFILLYSITKNILLIAPFILGLYCVYLKRYKLASIIVGGYLVARIIYTMAIKILFNGSAVSGQFETLMLKNYYNASEGREDISGLVVRYFENFNHHISTDVLRILGWRVENAPLEPIGFMTLLFLIFFLAGGYYMFKKREQHKLYLGIYLAVIISVVFVALQTHWKQDRMIIVYVPLILTFLFSVFYHFVKDRGTVWRTLFFISIPLLLLIQLRHLPQRISDNRMRLAALMSGDIYGVYTQDWQNYLKMSKWSADNLPAGAKVLCRKPNTSIVYADGKNIFEGLFRSTQDTGDKVLSDFKQINATHMMVCNLRINPSQAIEGQVIGTVHTYLRALYTYNQESITLVHSIGTSEPCNLYKINFD